MSVDLEILRIWEGCFKSDDDVLMPLFYPSLKQGGLLFVGLNPSFSAAGMRRLLVNTSYATLNPGQFFHWRNRANFDVKTAKAIEVIAKRRYAYYAKFGDFAHYVGMDWEHVDLFFYRETSASRLRDLIFEGNTLTQFGRDQIDISKRIVAAVRPKAVVVANALASRLAENEYNAAFDEKHGHHWLQVNDEVIPAFLAGMFTGQRAMDNYSYQRLRWQVRKVLTQYG
jgi:hypothetical protein